MRSFTRAVVVSAMALPLAIGGAGVASADDGKPEQSHGYHHGHKDKEKDKHKGKHKGDKCVYQSCKVDVDKKKEFWLWGWNWKKQDIESEKNIINAGVL